MNHNIQWEQTKKLLSELTPSELVNVEQMVANELVRRTNLAKLEADKQEKRCAERYEGCREAICNFLLGVAHAMACRYALRWAAGHDPVGKACVGGAPWTPVDGAWLTKCVEQQLGPKRRCEVSAGTRLTVNPLHWASSADIRAGLKEPMLRASGFLSRIWTKPYVRPLSW